MKQVLQAAKGGKTRVADVEPPELRPGAVLVRTRWSSVSAGTERMVIDLASKSLVGKAIARPDLVRKTIEKVKREGLAAAYRTVSGRLAGDVPLGYSAAGEVLAVADGVSGIAPGDLVACAGAGYANHAEILSVPRNLCARVPHGVGLRDAASATLAAIALHGVRTADLRLGETAVVIGLGILGQLAVQMLRASGVRVVALDRDPARAELARTLGADVALSGEDPEPVVRGMTSGHGADAALVCAASESSEPLLLAARLCRRRGAVVIVGAVGMELERRLFYEKELSVRMSTSYGPGRYDTAYEERGIDYPYAHVRWTEGRNLDAVLALIASGAVKVAPLVTHEFGIGEAERAYDLVRGERGDPYLGILLRYDGKAEPARRAAASPRAPRNRPAGAVRLGVIGAGQFGAAVLLPAFRDAGDVAFQAVATAGGASADAAKRQFGFARTSAAPEIPAAPDVDAVVIATRHDSHAALAASCIVAGVPCFVEKPLAITPAQLDELEDRWSKGPTLVHVGFNRRFAPATVALVAELARRRSPFHARYRVNAGAMPAGHWTLDPEVGGGRIVGEACHFVDLLSHLAGSPVVRVQAERLPGDGASCLLRFADGSTASLDYVATGDPSIPKEHLDLHWEGESYVLDDFRRLARHAKGASADLWKGSQDKGHRQGVAAFVKAVRTGGSAPVPFEQAAASTRATFAVLDALALGTAVDLPR